MNWLNYPSLSVTMDNVVASVFAPASNLYKELIAKYGDYREDLRYSQ